MREEDVISILWDASSLWGYLALHAMRSAGLPHRLLKGKDIAQAGVAGKVLLAPGGSARRKAAALGPEGCEAVRRFVSGGGRYLGFCGGAGLALADGLGLCPWGRADMGDRLQHLVSGHVACALTPHALTPPGMERALLPVWWPARFEEPEDGGGATVLARYQSPGPDLYVADLPFAMLPAPVRAEWHAMFGVDMRPTLLDSQPCVICGDYGQGSWFLSYSHLETPSGNAQSDANRWLFHLLRLWLGEGDPGFAVPEWRRQGILWDDAALREARQAMDGVLELAESLGLLFARTSWLRGWRTGIPGAQFNALSAALDAALALAPTDRLLAFWRGRSPDFSASFRLFAQAAQSWLLARRLAETLDHSLPGILPKALLVDQRDMLFGSHMAGGGLCGQLQDMLEELLFV